MTIKELCAEGYRLQSWKVSAIRNGVRMITILLTDAAGWEYIAACPCTDKKLIDENFTDPIKL